MSALDQLLGVATAGAPAATPDFVASYLAPWGRIGNEFAALVQRTNGFFAFESALHVLGFDEHSNVSVGQDIVSWNRGDGWIDSYGGLAADRLYLAEDVFGNQFAIALGGEVIVSFDAETGECEVLATSIEGWASTVLAEMEFRTGFPLAHDWQVLNGALTPGFRLLPRVPFVLGGEYSVQNLHDLRAEDGMTFRGGIARQIADAPDGATIQMRFEL